MGSREEEVKITRSYSKFKPSLCYMRPWGWEETLKEEVVELH